MNTKTVSSTIEILGKLYPIRCTETELPSLLEAAQYLNQRMLEVQESGKVINLERIAIITALNIANQLLQGDQQKNSVMSKINHRIAMLQDKLDSAINHKEQAEFVYSSE